MCPAALSSTLLVFLSFCNQAKRALCAKPECHSGEAELSMPCDAKLGSSTDLKIVDLG